MPDATQVQIRRDTGSNLDAATPALAELGYNTTTKRLHIGDGSTAGGTRLPNSFDIQNQTMISGTVGGTPNAITLTIAPGLSGALPEYFKVTFKATANNTGATTMNVNGTGAVSIKKIDGGVLADLEADDIVDDVIYELIHDGTQYQIKLFSTGGGGAQVLLDVQTASNSPQLSFTAFSSDYNEYEWVFENLARGGSGGSALIAQFGTPTIQTNNYTTLLEGYSNITGGAATDFALFGSTDGVYLTPITSATWSNASSDNLNGSAKLIGAGLTNRYKRLISQVEYNANFTVANSYGQYGGSTNAVSRVDFKMSGGANLPSGKIYMYGRRNA